jgi:hypothetical protein
MDDEAEDTTETGKPPTNAEPPRKKQKPNPLKADEPSRTRKQPSSACTKPTPVVLARHKKQKQAEAACSVKRKDLRTIMKKSTLESKHKWKQATKTTFRRLSSLDLQRILETHTHVLSKQMFSTSASPYRTVEDLLQRCMTKNTAVWGGWLRTLFQAKWNLTLEAMQSDMQSEFDSKTNDKALGLRYAQFCSDFSILVPSIDNKAVHTRKNYKAMVGITGVSKSKGISAQFYGLLDPLPFKLRFATHWRGSRLMAEQNTMYIQVEKEALQTFELLSQQQCLAPVLASLVASYLV